MPASLDATRTSLIDDSRFHILVLVLLSVLVVGYNLGATSLYNWDEAKHAVIAREIAADDHWISPTFHGNPYFFKPPLRMWLSALTFKVAGVNEWTVRLWSALFAIGTILSLYVFGRRLWGTRVGFLSAFILLTSHQYIYNHCARTGETDSMLIFCWTLGLLLLQLAVQEQNRRILYAAAGFIGLCGMVKHLGFVPIALSVAIGYVLLSGAWRTFPLAIWTRSLGVLAAVVLPWHLVQWWRHGDSFTQAYFLGEVVDKRLNAGAGSPRMSSLGQWASLVTMARGLFPWSAFLPFAFVDLLGKEDFRRRWLMPILWFLTAIGITVLSGRKYSWYVLPAFPAAAILVGRLLDRFLTEPRALFPGISVLLGSLIALTSTTDAATHNPFAVRALRDMLSVDFLGRLPELGESSFMIIGWLALFAGIALLIYWGLGRLPDANRARGWARSLLVLSVAGIGLYGILIPLRFSRTRTPIHRMASHVEDNAGPDEILALALPRRKINTPPFAFYLGERRTRRVSIHEVDAAQLVGRLILTDWPTLESINEATTDKTLTHTIVAQERGLLLVRWR